MARRYVQKSRFDDQGKIIPEVMAVVTSRDDLIVSNDEQQYFKRNYSDAIRKIIPKFYFSDEQSISGTHVAYPNQLINSHILANKNQANIFPVSSLTYDEELSSLGTPQGFARYFYKTQNPAQLNADDFERNILAPLNVKLKDYATSQAFVDYVSGTLLPSIPLVHAGDHAADNLATLTASAFSNDSSGTYKYLANNLGWVYFLNRSGPAPVSLKPTPFDPSTALPELLAKTVWQGKSIVLQDTLALYQEYLWKNQPTFTTTDDIIPASYTSSLDSSVGVFTSGTQQVDRLKTLVDIVYSPHFLDSTDNKVKSAFTSFFDTSSVTADGVLITDVEEAGPLKRFVDSISFAIADRVTEQAELNVLYDIGKCPEEFLELLGELIGWKFIGGDIDKWRVQLRNAVDIYKMKGTKRSIQYLLDTLFSTGVFSTPTQNLKELWESYVPDLIYYSLATSSAAFQNFDTYTPELAKQFGVTKYDPANLNTNIKMLVDKIMFDLVREFPNSFFLGGKPFPVPQLQWPEGSEEGTGAYIGPYNIKVDSEGDVRYFVGSQFEAASEELTLHYDPEFVFQYRGGIQYIPPYEKRQYYMPTKISSGMLERINYYLRCYGVDTSFANQVTDYIDVNTVKTLDTDSAINSFLFFTKEKKYAPNYDTILKNVTAERTPDPVSLLSLWNGKSSHFIINFDASSFNFNSDALEATSKYGLTKVVRVLNQVIPAHAMPEILVGVSSVADSLDAIADNPCQEWRPNFNDLYEGSSTVTTGWATCAVDMANLSLSAGLTPNRFKRTDVNNINDIMVSGSGQAIDFVARGAAPRNSLRRRSFKNLLPEGKLFTRGGRNNPGSLELSTSYYSSATGYLPLGFVPSSQHFQEVSLVEDTQACGIGYLLGDVHPVWEICQNLTSPSSHFGYDVSNTFASRAKQNVPTSSCNTYGRRGQLPEIVYMMTRVNDLEKYLQASSLVSGCFDPQTGVSNTDWPSESSLLRPTSFQDWFNQFNTTYDPMDSVVRSIANQLIENDNSDTSLHDYDHFTFGRKVHRLYNDYMGLFGGHGTTNNYNLLGVPNMFSHSFGPLIYNSNLDTDGSALDASGYLSASSSLYEADIAFADGSGVLSISGTSGSVYEVGTVTASDSTDLYLSKPEFRNKHLVSGVELVDTSSDVTVPTGPSNPTFSLFRLSRDDQSKYSYAKYLINNQIIKYHRGESGSTFPRIRIVIDPSDTTQAKNFLQPNHEYEITVKAHNISRGRDLCGGQSLGCWIHTLDEGYGQVWSFDPQGVYDDCGREFDRWEIVTNNFLNSTAGINWVENKVQLNTFDTFNIDNIIGTGESYTDGPLLETTYDYRCWEPIGKTQIVEGSNPLAIVNINENSLQEMKFRFTTNNDFGVTPPTAEYEEAKGYVHRTDQKYAIELFVRDGDERRFVVIEEISIVDLTNYNNAVIETDHGDAQLTVQDFKSVCRYFKSLSSGLASRDAYNTSAVMEVSGGSRLNYRSASGMYEDETAIMDGGALGWGVSPVGFFQVSSVDIYEG
jgi:hypothetical protein